MKVPHHFSDGFSKAICPVRNNQTFLSSLAHESSRGGWDRYLFFASFPDTSYLATFVISLRGLSGFVDGETIGYHSGDVSDEARRNIRSRRDRVSEVGSRDSGKPRAQP